MALWILRCLAGVGVGGELPWSDGFARKRILSFNNNFDNVASVIAVQYFVHLPARFRRNCNYMEGEFDSVVTDKTISTPVVLSR